tara:strand:- start:613 stop:813 length:201 start_codon:yes stop_codon:yes gene_type:complete
VKQKPKVINVLNPEETQELLDKWKKEIAAMEKRQDAIAAEMSAEIQGRYDAATAEETDPNCPFADN